MDNAFGQIVQNTYKNVVKFLYVHPGTLGKCIVQKKTNKQTNKHKTTKYSNLLGAGWFLTYYALTKL